MQSLTRMTTDDEIVRTLDAGGIPTDTIKDGEWFGLVSFTAIVSVHHKMRPEYCNAPFTPPLAWSFERFHVN